MKQDSLDRLLDDVECQAEALLDYWRKQVKEWCSNRAISDNEKQPMRNGKEKDTY